MILLDRYLRKFIKENYVEGNLVFQIFKNYLPEIINGEGRYHATLFVESKFEDILNGYQLKDKQEDIKVYESIQEQLSKNKIFISKVWIKGIKGIINVQDKCKNKDISCKDGLLMDLEERKSAIIFGWNGEGKSSIVEGMEFCLTGDVVESKRRGVKKGEIKNYILNSDSKTGVVKIELHQPYKPPKKVIIERTTDNLSAMIKINNKENDLYLHIKDNIEIYEEYFSKHFIEKNRIENFVLSKGAENRQRYGELLGLEELNDFIKNSWRRYNSEKKQKIFEKSNLIENKYNMKKEELIKLKEKEICEPRIEINDDEKNLILSLFEINKTSLHNSINFIVEDDFIEKLNTKIDKMSNNEQKVNDLVQIQDYIEKYLQELKEYKKITIETKSKENIMRLCKFYELAINIIKEDDKGCPLCGSNKLFGNELKQKIQNDYNELEHIKSIISKKEELLKKINKLSGIIHSKIIVYFPEYNNYNEYELDLENENILRKIENKINNIKSENKKNIKLLKEIRIKILKYKRDYEEYLKRKEENKNKIKRLNKELLDLEKELKKEVEINELKEKMLYDIKEFENKLNDFYLQILTNELKNISENIKKYYNQFEIDNPFNKIELIATKNEITFAVEFKEGKKLDPLKVLSEGQLRCFGLAILLAIADNINASFIILDDVVNAIDIEHRAQIIKVLKEQIENGRQIILTTHDKLFREKLVNSISNSKKIKTFYFPKRGIIYEDTKEIDFEQKIYDFIEKKDCRSALIYMRLLLENTLYSMADGSVSLLFKDSVYKYQLSEVFNAVASIDENVRKIKHYFMSNNMINWVLLNQEHHFWSEQSLCLDCNILKELAEKVVSLKIIHDFNCLDKEEKDILIKQKNLDKPIIEEFHKNSRVFSKGFIDGDRWGDKFKLLKKIL